MKKWFVALLGVTLHASLLPTLTACQNPQEPNRQEEIIWLNLGGDTKKTAAFIPEKLLQKVDWSKLPLKESDHSGLEAALRHPEVLEERRKLLGREENPCWNQNAPSGEGGSHQNAKELRDWLKEFELVVIGRVEDVVPGWSSWGREVAQMVYVRVLDVQQDQAEKTKSGTVLLYELHYGLIELKGIKICRDPWKGFKVPVTGDEILLLGRPFWSDPSYMDFTFVFPVEDGRVQYHPYRAVKRFKPIDLRDLI